MLVFRRFFIWFLAILILVIWEMVVYFPKYYLWWIVLLVLLLLSVIYLIYNRKSLTAKELLLLTVTPFFLTLGTFSFLFFLEKALVIQLVIILSTVFLAVYLDNFFFFSRLPFLYKTFSLESFSFLINIYSLFLIMVSLTSLKVFLNINYLIELAILLVVILIILIESFWINKFKISEHWYYILIITLIILEMNWAIELLPFSTFVKALFLVAIFYFLSNLTFLKLKDLLSRHRFVFNLVLFLAVSLLTIISTRWT